MIYTANNMLTICNKINNSHVNKQLCKQTIDQSELSDRARNCRRIEMVSIRQISCATRQKWATCEVRQETLSPNKVARQSCSTLLHV